MKGEILESEMRLIRFRTALRLAPAFLFLLPVSAVFAQSVFFTTEKDPGPPVGIGSINRVNLDGSGLQSDIVPGTISPTRGLTVDPVRRQLYYLSGQWVTRTGLDGSSPEAVAPSPSFPNGVDMDDVAIDPLGGKLYVANRGGRALGRMDLDGSNAEEISQPGVDIYQVALDPANGKVYYTDAAFGTEQRILRSDLDGANPETIGPLDFPVFDVGVNPKNGMIYFLESDSSTSTVFIKRMNPDGSGLSTVLGGAIDPDAGNLPQFRDFDFDPSTGNLIVSDTMAGEIFLVDPAGTGRTAIVTGLLEPSEVAFLPEPDAIWAVLGAMAALLALRIRGCPGSPPTKPPHYSFR